MSQKIDELKNKVQGLTERVGWCSGYSWNDPAVRAWISELDEAERELNEAIAAEEREIRMFGMTVEKMVEEKSDLYDNLQWAMNILSDSQYMIGTGDDETARIFINKAKFWIDADRQRQRDEKVFRSEWK